MQLIVQGFILGFIIVLPGMSGGTLLLIFGLYERLLSDLSRFRILPYLPFITATCVGIYASGLIFTFLFELHRDFTTSFLMGGVLASVRPVLGQRPVVSGKLLFLAGVGLVAGILLTVEPIGILAGSPEPGLFRLVIGGALGSAAMLIPGIPGSSVLIILGIYDNVLRYLAELNIYRLSVFLVGSFLGVFLLAQAVDRFYSRHRLIVSWLFSGLIIGSARALLPLVFTFPVVFFFVLGFGLVWSWDIWRQKNMLPTN